MLKFNNDHFSSKVIYGFWMLLAFQAGYVNVGGFMTSGSFVSHVTGTTSRIGMNIGELTLDVAFGLLTFLFAFISGAMFSGYFLKHEDKKQSERYLLVLGTKAILFASVLLLSMKSEFSYIITLILAFCCGAQNATCSLSTNGFFKPTHMTGLSTDLGISLSSLIKGELQKNKEEMTKTLLRVSILLSFLSGGIISSLVFSGHGHYGFLFPFVSSLCFLGLGVVRDIKKLGRESFAFRAFQSSIPLTFFLTVAVGISQGIALL